MTSTIKRGPGRPKGAVGWVKKDKLVLQLAQLGAVLDSLEDPEESKLSGLSRFLKHNEKWFQESIHILKHTLSSKDLPLLQENQTNAFCMLKYMQYLGAINHLQFILRELTEQETQCLLDLVEYASKLSITMESNIFILPLNRLSQNLFSFIIQVTTEQEII
jgi:hypothetical protein